MSLPYRFDAQGAVLETMSSATKREREELLKVFRTLADDPFIRGEYMQKDDRARDCQVKRFGKWSVTFYSEHMASEVHILDIKRVG